MKILITGSAGFIGSALCERFLKLDNTVLGLDNFNSYYEPTLKHDRIKKVSGYSKFENVNCDISNRDQLSNIFKKFKPDIVLHMAAQAGVRYSIENPNSYIDSNLVGFGNILEGCRQNNIKHLVYASSSSVYGANSSMPFSVRHNVDHPLSLYAATKKANELMAHTYSYLFNLPTTGLRFFTVYGPWDRPDMALQKFAKSIMNNEPINIFNNGNHKRDFTFIDDIVECIVKVAEKPAEPDKSWDSKNPNPASSMCPWKIYNIGNNKPVNLMDYIKILEKELNKEAKKKFLPMQQGDVLETFANIDDLSKDFNYKPKISVEVGIKKFSDWFKEYYKW